MEAREENSGIDGAVDVVFRYDYGRQEWVVSEDADLLQKEIEELPCVLVIEFFRRDEPENRFFPWGEEVPYEGRYVFCQKHRRLEKIVKDEDVIVSEEGCRFSGLAAMGRVQWPGSWYWIEPSVLYIPFRWRLFQKGPGKPLNISGDVAAVKLRYHGALIQWHVVAYSVHIASRRLAITQPDILDTWESPADGDIPEPVVAMAMEMLRRETELDCGMKPSVLSRMGGHRRIASYIERPFDLNIVYLKTFLREFIGREFHRVFPYEAKDNYREICRLLEIHPPKSLRRAYTFNPYAVVWYMYLQECGISDINLMQPFFGLHERILNVPLRRFYFSRKEKTIRFVGDTEEKGWWNKGVLLWHWELAKFYCQWLLQQGRKKKFLRWLREASQGAELHVWQWDILRAFQEHYEDLSDQVKNRLLREGLTRRVHDIISLDVRKNFHRLTNVVMEYPPAILAYECSINGYEFRLVKETRILFDISSVLENCVVTYRKAVIDRESIIVSVQYEGEYVACIELQQENHIVQALGKYNRWLVGELLLVCRAWARHCQLQVDVNHLDLVGTDERGEPLRDLGEDEIFFEKIEMGKQESDP